MFGRVPNVGPREAVDAFPAKGLHQLEPTTGPSEPVPVQAVLVKAVGCVDVRTKVKWADGAHDQALFSEHTNCEVFFKRARATGINPHAALTGGCRRRDVWSGIPIGDDSRGHD